MKTLSRSFILVSSAVAKNIRVILLVATLVLFVLAAGAPSATGSVGGQSFTNDTRRSRPGWVDRRTLQSPDRKKAVSGI